MSDSTGVTILVLTLKPGREGRPVFVDLGGPDRNELLTRAPEILRQAALLRSDAA